MATDPITSFVVEDHPAGHAVVIMYTRPSSVAGVRIRRKADSAPSGPDDATSDLLYDGPGEPRISGMSGGGHRWYVDHETDDNTLANGTTYHYSAWAFDASRVYSTVVTTSVTPGSTTYEFDKADVKGIMIQRIKLGLNDLLTAGTLKIGKARTALKVYATFPLLVDKATYPCVSVHRDSDAVDEEYLDHYIGEGENPYEESLAGRHERHEGHFSRVNLLVLAHSNDPGERDRMATALDTVLNFNETLLEYMGLHDSSWSIQDFEDPEDPVAPFKARVPFDCRTLTRRIETETTAVSGVTLTSNVSYQQYDGLTPED